jgi:hypothetical protein
MAWIDDYTINSTIRTVRHTSGTVVYSVNVEYSALKDWEDDPANMTHPVVMTAQTPTEYTLVNGWFQDDPSTNFLNGGAITTSGYASEIQRIVTTDAGVDPIGSDLGKVVSDSGAGTSGELLHFDLDINDDGTQVHAWYVRSGDGTAYTANMTIAAGTGAQAVATSIDGEEIWTNVFSFGVLGSTVNPQFYIEQQLNGTDHRVIEWVANSNFSRGAMDVLLRTQIGGTAIDSGDMLITIRQPGTTYDSSEQTLNGQRNPFALNAADDPDNLTSEWYVLFDVETGTDFVVGDTITADSKAWYATVNEVAYFTDTATGYLGLIGLNESVDVIADNDVFTSSGSGTASINGTAGDRIIAYDTQVGEFTVGLILTGVGSGAKSRIRGIDDVTTTGYLVLEVDIGDTDIDFKEDPTYYDLYTDNEQITDTSTGDADANLVTTGEFLNKQLGTSGMRGKVEFVFQNGSIGTSSNDLQVGDHVTVTAGGAGETGIVTRVDGSTIHFGNTNADFATGMTVSDDDSARQCITNTGWTDLHVVVRAFSQAAGKDYDVIVFMQLESVQRAYEYAKFLTGDGNEIQFEKYDLTGAALVRTPVDGQFYLSAYFDLDTPSNTYDKVGKRAAPLGTFAGGTWFTARGLWLEDVLGADSIKFQLIDSDNAVQNPPNFVVVETTNNVSGDQQGVYEDDGTGLVKKDTYNSHATFNGISTSAFDTDGTPAIRLDSPSEGWLLVTDDSSTSGQLKEHAYYYDSFSGDIFTLDPIADATADGASTGLTLEDTGRNFTSDGVRPGMMIFNTTDGSKGIVATVGTTTLTAKFLEGGTGDTFEVADNVEINKLLVLYEAADTAFVPYISENAGGTTTTVTVIYVSDRVLLSTTRNKGVIFATDAASNITSTGASIPVVRTTDGIAS